MYKVLIVDDDLLVRNYLRTLINWENYGYKIVNEASNGKVAIEIIQQNSIDLIIFDLNMPIMDGVALSEYICKKYPSIKMFALSSFNDFNYVRQTLKNGAIDYLLKDQLEPNELIKLLNKIKEINIEEQKKNDEINNTKNKLKEVGQVVREQYIKELLLDSKEFLKYNSELLDDVNINSNGRFIIVIALQITNFFLITNNYNDIEKDKVIKSIKNLCSQIFNGEDTFYIIYIDEGRFGILYIPYSCISEAEALSRLNQYIKRLSESLNRYLNMQFIWGNSSPCIDIRKISLYYKKACEFLNLNYKIKNKNIKEEKFENDTPKIVSLSVHNEKDILNAIEIGDTEKIKKIIDEVFISLDNARELNISMQLILNELITIAVKTADEYKLDIQKIYESWPDYKRENFASRNDVQKAKDWIIEIFIRLITESKSSCYSGDFSQYTRKAIEYINNNFRKDISLNQVSEILGLSTPYFSKLFKKETKYGFTEYLNFIRVNKAIKIMESGNKNLKNVYIESGFNNYNYFFKVFKEIVGCTPLNYIKNK